MRIITDGRERKLEDCDLWCQPAGTCQAAVVALWSTPNAHHHVQVSKQVWGIQIQVLTLCIHEPISPTSKYCFQWATCLWKYDPKVKATDLKKKKKTVQRFFWSYVSFHQTSAGPSTSNLWVSANWTVLRTHKSKVLSYSKASETLKDTALLCGLQDKWRWNLLKAHAMVLLTEWHLHSSWGLSEDIL